MAVDHTAPGRGTEGLSVAYLGIDADWRVHGEYGPAGLTLMVLAHARPNPVAARNLRRTLGRHHNLSNSLQSS